MANENDGTAKDKRTNDILLGPLERPALQFFAKHMPAWVNSDMLTVLGLLGSVLAGFAYAMVGRGEIKGNIWLFVASLGFIINWFGDSLDGTLARYRHHERPNYGYYTDHAIDGITSLILFAGIGLAGIARFDISMIALSGWLLLMIQVYLKTHVTGTFEMTSIGIGPTEVRLIAIILNTTLFFTGIGGYLYTPTIQGQEYGLTIGSLIVALLTILFLAYYIYQVISTGVVLAAQDEARLLKRKQKEAANEEICKLNLRVDRMIGDLQYANSKIEALNQQLAAKQLKIDELEITISKIMLSKSWTITRPMRKITNAIKGRLG